MKKLIFTLFVAFFVASLAVNAQNSSKLSYNNDGSVTLSEELKTKLKAKGISEEDYLKQITTKKQEQQSTQTKQTTPTQPKIELKAIDKTQLKLKQSTHQLKTVDKKAMQLNPKESLKAKAVQMNLDFAKKGLQYKTQIKTFAGKQYIEIIDLPKQNGMIPAQSKQ